eukprot:5567934-Prymnesium_polylepis.1
MLPGLEPWLSGSHPLNPTTGAPILVRQRVMYQALPAPLPAVANSAPVPMLTLDALLLDGEGFDDGSSPPTSIDVVKIDTAGSECEVLEGGTRALTHKLRPRLLLVNIEAPSSEACVCAFAERHAFAMRTLAPQRRGKHLVLVDSQFKVSGS